MHQLQLLSAKGIVDNLARRLDGCDPASETAETMAFHQWTNYVRNWLMYVSAVSFVSHWEEIAAGTYTSDLLEGSHHRFTVRALKAEMYQEVYPRLTDIHLAASTVLTDLMNRFGDAVIHWDSEVPLNMMQQSHISLIPAALKEDCFREKTGDPGA